MEHNQHEIGELEAVNVNAFSAKFKSKREIFSFLTIDAGAYLPSHEVLTIYFLKDLVNNENFNNQLKCGSRVKLRQL